MLFSGQAPKTELFPHDWYNSPNIHFLTINDFEQFCTAQKFPIERRYFLSGETRVKNVPNLAAALAAVLCLAGGMAGAQDWRRHGEPAEQRRESYPPPPGPRPVMERPDQGYGPYRGPPASYAPPFYQGPPPGRAPAAVGGWREPERESTGQGQPKVADLDWIIGNLGHRVPGKQLNSDFGYLDGRPVYRVLWITAHGRRIDFVIDAASGAILSER